MKRIISFFLIILLSFSLGTSAFAHPGSTDSNGGHYDHSTGEYHFHHGYPAHQHYDMDGDGVIDCPYDFDDKTGQNSGNSSSSGSSGSSGSSSRSSSSLSIEEKEQIIKNVKNGTDDYSGWRWVALIACILLVICIAAGVISPAVTCIIIIINDIKKKKKKAIEEAEAKAKYEVERNELIDRIGNKSLREIAKVPDNIRFINGLPVDNNDSQFGSFTVYVSASGNCYHTKKGCSSARIAMHIVKAKGRYKPCSRCCKGSYQIPQWYRQYKAIREKCKEYNIPFDS